MTDDSTLSDFLPSAETDEEEDRRSPESGEPIDADGADSDDDDVAVDADVTDADTDADATAADTDADTTDADVDADADTTDGDSPEPTDGNSPTAPAPVTGDTGLSTYAWGSYTCARCDTETDRVWRADGALVCPDCKPW